MSSATAPIATPTGALPAIDGLSLLLERAWGQEVVHQLVLRELLQRTDLAAVLGLWASPEPPTVMYEPFGGLFDLALPSDSPRILIELKVSADLGDNQRARQHERAVTLLAQRVYILLGPSYFMALDEPDARNIGAPDLAHAIRSLAGIEDITVRELAAAYVQRLEADAAGWGSMHEARSTSGLDLFRLYAEMAAAWPVTVRPIKVTHHGGPDWIINANAWTTSAAAGWAGARFYWEMVNGRTRFKIQWEGDEALRMTARNAFRDALEAAARELGVPASRTHARAGAYMTALELAGDARDEVLVDGRVDAERSRGLYDRATAVFRRSLDLLPQLVGDGAG